LIIAAALTWAIASRAALSVTFACGLALYLAYVVSVGGDFMSGRFLTAPFVCAALFIAREAGRRLENRLPMLVAMSATVVIAGMMLSAPPAGERVPGFHGILDEQRVYASYTGLFASHRPAEHSWARTGASMRLLPHVMVYEAVGLLGYHAGPGVHIIDPMGLTDPLIARQPALPDWRIGHFRRAIPDGYVAGLDECLRRIFPHGAIAPPTQSCLAWPTETNRIADLTLAREYDSIRLITEGPLFSGDRWRAILGVRR
jgi:arabinofuranosyltransferase